jgi:large subunit ribosomal protein L35
MPKMKTNSSVKKRFKLTASNKLKGTQANKQHLMRKKTNAQIRNLRGTTILEGKQAQNVKKFFMPYG